jgi:hypothetical protein
VTAETEVPAVPAKDARKKQPDQNDFEKKMRELDNQIETLRNKIVYLFVSNFFLEKYRFEKEGND